MSTQLQNLTVEECDLILQSLEYTKRAFVDYTDYPSYEFKMARIAEVNTVRDKIRYIRKAQA